MTNPLVLGIVPARGGSKGVPRKNIRPLAGRPLIVYTIAAAAGAVHLDRFLVSTDDEEIAAIARSEGAWVPFLRPAEYATDRASCVFLIQHALDWLAEHERYVPDAVAFLPPTSPLRTAADIDGTIESLWSSGLDSAVTVYPVDDHPWYIYSQTPEKRLVELISGVNKAVCRQELPEYVTHSQAVIASTHAYMRSCTATDLEFNVDSCVGYRIPRQRALDIDTLFDFKLAEQFLLDIL